MPVGSGADAFVADSRAEEVNRILGELDELAPPTATLAAAPEGIMLNYLTRRRSSTPYITLMPVELLMFGEQEILESFRSQPPEFLVLTDEELNDYGFKYFSDCAPSCSSGCTHITTGSENRRCWAACSFTPCSFSAIPRGRKSASAQGADAAGVAAPEPGAAGAAAPRPRD